MQRFDGARVTCEEGNGEGAPERVHGRTDANAVGDAQDRLPDDLVRSLCPPDTGRPPVRNYAVVRPTVGEATMKQLALPLAVLALLGLAGHASARTSAASSPTVAAACAPGYRPCLPVREDLDCGQIADRLKPERVTGDDPYALDRDRDGLGCEPSGWGGSGPGAGALSPWGLDPA